MIDRLRYLLGTRQNRWILFVTAGLIAFGFFMWSQLPNWREAIESAVVVSTLTAPPLAIFISWQQQTWSNFESRHDADQEDWEKRFNVLQAGMDNIYGASQERINNLAILLTQIASEQKHLTQQTEDLSRRIGENYESLREMEAVRKIFLAELRENRQTDYRQGMEIAKLSGAWEYLSTHEVRRLQGEYDQVQAQVRGYESWREFVSADFHKLKMEVVLMQRLLNDETQPGGQDGEV